MASNRSESSQLEREDSHNTPPTPDNPSLLITVAPDDILLSINENGYLTERDLVSLAGTSRSTLLLFQEPIKTIKMTKLLLRFVTQSNYAEAQHIVDIDPNLMFQHVRFVYPNGNIEMTSPLKYAFRIYDTYMWKMFLEKIQSDLESLKRFLSQAHERKHLDLDPLHNEYTEYKALYDQWLEEEIGDQELDEAWLKLGAKQYELLVRGALHMLMELCREGNYWKTDSKFDISLPPKAESCRAHNYFDGKYIPFSSLVSPTKLGKQHTLTRGSAESGALPTSQGRPRRNGAEYFVINSWEHDAKMFRDLHEKRNLELITQISLLEQSINDEARITPY